MNSVLVLLFGSCSTGVMMMMMGWCRFGRLTVTLNFGGNVPPSPSPTLMCSGVRQWRPQTMTMTAKDNLLKFIQRCHEFGVSFSHFHCCGCHGIGPMQHTKYWNSANVNLSLQTGFNLFFLNNIIHISVMIILSNSLVHVLVVAMLPNSLIMYFFYSIHHIYMVALHRLGLWPKKFGWMGIWPLKLVRVWIIMSKPKLMAFF